MKETASMTSILALLSFTATHNQHREELMRATGEHFNIFKILGIGRYEVTTHSPVLAELLNPKGTHGQGATFLHLFLTQFGIKDFDAKRATTKMEHHIGQIAGESGGRIDIFINDGSGKPIVIENKIDAPDQEKQIPRYRNKYLNAHLFYLTLNGGKPENLEPDEVSSLQLRCISYAREIREWLKACRSEAACLPTVRETISQYIHLIEELTNQSTNTAMSKELIDHLTNSQNPESLRAFYALRAVEETVQTELMNRLNAKLAELAKANSLEFHKPLGGSNGLCLMTPGLARHNLQVCFEFQSAYRDLFFGFKNTSDKSPCAVQAQLQVAFKQEFGSADQPNNWWPAGDFLESPYRDWGHDAFEAILSGQMNDSWQSKFEKLAKIAKLVCPDDSVPRIG